ncbi:MAG: ABC transporter permease [Herpetosiphon sp.]
MSILSNPVLVKELRQRMRAPRAFRILTGFLTLLSLFMLLVYQVQHSQLANDPFTAGASIGKSLFIGAVVITLLQLLVIVASQAAATIVSEKERETYDLLILTLLPAWKIVVGKLLAALAFAMLLVVAVVPFMALAFLFGGVSVAEFNIAILGLITTTVFYGSLGIWSSTVARRTATATALTQTISLLVLIGVPVLMLAFGLLFLGNGRQTPPWFETYPFIYGTGWIIMLNPFVALGITETLMSNGDSRWLLPLPWNTHLPTAVLVPAPWLSFVLISTLLSLLLLGDASRRIRRVRSYRQSRRRGHPLAADQ